VVHLPVYQGNAYQRLLMYAQRQLGLETIDGGGGGNFFRTTLIRWKADMLHFHWLHPYMIRPSTLGTVLRSTRLLIELSILKLFGQRIVWTVHNLKNHDNRHVALERWFTKRFARLPSAIIAHSQRAATEAASAFAISDPDRIYIVPYGNYVGCYPNQVSRREAREKLGLDPEPVVFLFLGRIQPYKGVPELIREFKTVPQEFRLVVAGRPADAEMAQTILDGIGAAQNIVFHPRFVPDEEIQFYMNACDAVVLPYRQVLTSSAAMLAISFGRACVAPRLSGMLELLDDRGAFLYDPAQPGALAKAIRAAANSRERLNQMGIHNLAKVSSQDWATVAAATLKIYQSVSSSCSFRF
jgi:beta-1,4-mannosyltransferase